VFKKAQTENITCKRFLPLLLLAIPSFTIQAQAVRNSSGKDSLSFHPKHKANREPNDSLYKQEDFTDVAFKILHIKIKPDTAKLKPGKLYLAVFPAVGYTTVNSGTATVAANASFYTARLDSTNLSSILTYPLYSLNKQIIVPVISSIWLKNNDINFLGDWRYYKYPSYTYGLGGSTSPLDADMLDYSYVKVYQEALKRLGENLYGGIGYNLDYHFDITETGTPVSDFDTYNEGATKSISSGLNLNIKYDSRTNINNPKDAFFGSLIYRYNSTLLGSDNNWQSLQVEMRKYIKISSNPNNVLAFWSWNVFTFGGKVPYLDLPSTGWDTYANTGRGYIQGRFRGTSLMYLESEYRFGITHNGLLGGVIFANGEIVPNWPNEKIQTVNPGEGIGLRIKLNRYSDTNLCVDYGFGNEGSKGIFFNLGEVF
jgi:outer membrane protein assembly factor BamA